MKRYTYILATATILLGACQQSPTTDMPAPTTIVLSDQEEEGKSEAREAWLEMIHRAAPGIDWKSINRQELEKIHKQRAILRENPTREVEESLAQGRLKGIWEERGSSNQAGNLASVTFMGDEELTIYGVSGGGTIWKGDLFGEQWTPLNEDLRFNTDVVEGIIKEDGSHRIFTATGKRLRYSDDQGASWKLCDGLDFDSEWGQARRLRRRGTDLYYMVFTWVNQVDNSRIQIFHSGDEGLSFQRILTLDHDIDFWPARNYSSLWVDPSETIAMVWHGQDQAYILEGNQATLITSEEGLPPGDYRDLEGALTEDGLTLYILADRTSIYRSDDTARTWVYVDDLRESSWQTGIAVWPTDPEILAMGAVDAFRSVDGGDRFDPINRWWEYYGDISKLHADMMDIRTFFLNESTPFALFANHGGLHLSFDQFTATSNIGKDGLNIGQFYDVVTDPLDRRYIYGGTQDQGHQVTQFGQEDGTVTFDQVISGDYGHYAFSRGGQSLWILYPFGSVQYYHNPRTDGPSSNFSIIGENGPASNWIYPTEETPDPDDNAIFIAGGNMNGGPGSYLIELTAEETSPYNVSHRQYEFDFMGNSNSGGATISSIEASEIQDGRLYVGMNDGSFFTSDDAGSTWTKTTDFDGPGEHWLYGADIYASRLTDDLVWFAGSGYGNPAIYESQDGGQSFTSVSRLLPSTVIHEIATDADETMLFAATDVGPYVYIREIGVWFPMLGETAPVQEYYSVEFIPEEDVVRFATHGRGIWDFNILRSVSTDDDEAVAQMLRISPNPASVDQAIRVSWDANQVPWRLSVMTENGQVIQEYGDLPPGQSTNVTVNAKGKYLIVAQSDAGRQAEWLIVQ